MKQQLELGFSSSTQPRPHVRVRRRPHGARWWFSQMRQAVDRAADHPPVPLPRPEQTVFSIVRRCALSQPAGTDTTPSIRRGSR